MKRTNTSSIDTQPTRNYAIDALRFIAVCFVVFIHIPAINSGFVYVDSFSWKVNDILYAISRLAVPLFFAISGWFIFSKNRSDQIQKLQKQIPKLIKILLGATIATSVALWIITQLHLFVVPIGYLPGTQALFEMFALGRSPTIPPLWFLASLIIVEILFLLASLKFKKDNWLLIPAFIFFGLNLALAAYRSVTGIPEMPYSVNEVWFVGFIWFSLGYFLAKYFKDKPEAIPSKTLLRFLAITGFFYLYECILHSSGSPFVFGSNNNHAVFIFTPFVTAAILLLAAQSKKDGKVIRTLAHYGKNYTLGIFIFHVVVMQPIDALFIRYGILIDHPTLKLIVTYTSVVLISLGLTAAYYLLKPKVKTAILKLPLKKS